MSTEHSKKKAALTGNSSKDIERTKKGGMQPVTTKARKIIQKLGNGVGLRATTERHEKEHWNFAATGRGYTRSPNAGPV